MSKPHELNDGHPGLSDEELCRVGFKARDEVVTDVQQRVGAEGSAADVLAILELVMVEAIRRGTEDDAARRNAALVVSQHFARMAQFGLPSKRDDPA